MGKIVKGVFFREDFLNMGLRIPVNLDLDITPHIAISGITGSGKTYSSKLLLGKLVKYIPDCQLYVCDGKGDRDFDFLSGAPRFSRGLDVGDTFDKFFDGFLERQRGSQDRHKIILFFDEWSSFVDSFTDKKLQNEATRKLSLLLRLGRSFGVHVIISQQRMDANYFQANRDNFTAIVALGQLSKEAEGMLFSSFKDELHTYPPRHRGTGFLLMNGAELIPIAVPFIQDIKKLEDTIRKGVTR